VTDRHFVSISAPPIEEIRARISLANTDFNLEDVPIERIRLDFTFRSEDGRTVFELSALGSSFDGETLTALVLDLLVGDKNITPETDTFVLIRIDTDEDGTTSASILASELTLFTLE